MTIRVLMKGEKNAEILIYSDIGDSWWGDVCDGLAIYRQLVDAKAEVITHVDGIAASAASVIAMAGSKILVAETSFIMIHDAWTIASGNASDLRDVAERVDVTSAELAKLYAARSGKTESEMRDYMLAETWFNAQDALNVGLATEIVENQRVAARAVPGFVDYIRNFAEIPEDKRPYRKMPTPPAATWRRWSGTSRRW